MLDHGTISQSLVLSTKIWSYVVYVLASRRSIPNDQKFMRRAHALERLDDEMHVVLRFKSRDIKHVTIWLDPPAIHQRIGTAFDFRSVRDNCRHRWVTRKIIFLNYFRIGNSFRRQNRRQPLGHQIILAADAIPFLAFVLEAIDIQRYRCACQAKDWRQGFDPPLLH